MITETQKQQTHSHSMHSTHSLLPFPLTQEVILRIVLFQGSPVIGDVFRFTIFYLEYTLLLVQLILCCFPDKSVWLQEDDESLAVYDKIDEKTPLLTSTSLKNTHVTPVLSSHNTHVSFIGG